MIRGICIGSELGLGLLLTDLGERWSFSALRSEEFLIKVVDVGLKPRALGGIEAVHHIGLHQSERVVARTASIWRDRLK
jgi:hypothetical protein